MLISEIYESRQGEGLLTGQVSLFIRTSGCNLRCQFCDTPYTSWQPTGQQMAIDQILADWEMTTDRRHVVITGGEPMLQKDLADLCQACRDRDWHITIETAGTVDRELACDLMSISPKLSNSTPERSRAGEWAARHEATRHRPQIVRRLIDRYPWQLKFVVDTPDDLAEIDQYVQALGTIERARVLLMPQGVERDELESRGQWLEPACRDRGFRYCPRMHIVWYGNRRGT